LGTQRGDDLVGDELSETVIDAGWRVPEDFEEQFVGGTFESRGKDFEVAESQCRAAVEEVSHRAVAKLESPLKLAVGKPRRFELLAQQFKDSRFQGGRTLNTRQGSRLLFLRVRVAGRARRGRRAGAERGGQKDELVDRGAIGKRRKWARRHGFRHAGHPRDGDGSG
jgi:hypothetical protein